MGPEWWQGSRVVAWSRWLLRRLHAMAAESATARWLHGWGAQWRAMARPKAFSLFLRGSLLGFIMVMVLQAGSLHPRELIIRAFVLWGVWMVLRWFLRQLAPSSSDDRHRS